MASFCAPKRGGQDGRTPQHQVRISAHNELDGKLLCTRAFVHPAAQARHFLAQLLLIKTSRTLVQAPPWRQLATRRLGVDLLESLVPRPQPPLATSITKSKENIFFPTPFFQCLFVTMFFFTLRRQFYFPFNHRVLQRRPPSGWLLPDSVPGVPVGGPGGARAPGARGRGVGAAPDPPRGQPSGPAGGRRYPQERTVVCKTLCHLLFAQLLLMFPFGDRICRRHHTPPYKPPPHSHILSRPPDTVPGPRDPHQAAAVEGGRVGPGPRALRNRHPCTVCQGGRGLLVYVSVPTRD